MTVFFFILAFGGPILLIWRGKAIRKRSFKRLSANEEGLRLMGESKDTGA